MSTNAFLDYHVGGTAYIPGLALLLLGLVLLSTDDPRRLRSAAGGAALAGAVLLWLPFVLSLPAALLAPILLMDSSRRQMRSVLMAIGSCAVIGLIAYLVVAAHLGIHNAREFTAWLSGASHGVTSINGLPRAIVGFSRSFLNMGTDGAALKRYLLKDPFNPVTFSDLFPRHVWKIVFVYSVTLTMLVAMWRSVWRKRLLFCTLTAAPVLAFAIVWQGGDTERYLPLYPAFMLAVGACVTTRSWAVGRIVVELFMLLALVINTSAHSRVAFAAEERDIVMRAGHFNHDLLPPSSIVVMPTMTDRTIRYFLSGAQDTMKIRGNFRFHPLVHQGAGTGAGWREAFAAKTLDTWDAGGRVWVSRRVLRDRPRPDWGWAEGEDAGISWPDFRLFFTTLRLGETIGGSEDGFVELPASQPNRILLEELRRRR
jgi:hypothetical protein